MVQILRRNIYLRLFLFFTWLMFVYGNEVESNEGERVDKKIEGSETRSHRWQRMPSSPNFLRKTNMTSNSKGETRVNANQWEKSLIQKGIIPWNQTIHNDFTPYGMCTSGCCIENDSFEAEKSFLSLTFENYDLDMEIFLAVFSEKFVDDMPYGIFDDDSQYQYIKTQTNTENLYFCLGGVNGEWDDKYGETGHCTLSRKKITKGQTYYVLIYGAPCRLWGSLDYNLDYSFHGLSRWAIIGLISSVPAVVFLGLYIYIAAERRSELRKTNKKKEQAEKKAQNQPVRYVRKEKLAEKWKKISEVQEEKLTELATAHGKVFPEGEMPAPANK